MVLDAVPAHGPITAILPDVPGPRGKGRHVFHDPASKGYAVTGEVPPGPIVHERHIPILDQGQLGSCTGNAGTGMLGTSPFFDTAPVRSLALNQPYAVGLYGQATHLDGIPGYYPPIDGGSSGLGVAKALRARGIIDRYEHAFSVEAMLTALRRAPVIVGTVWLSGMNTPDSRGFVQLTGKAEGGHEYLCREYEPVGSRLSFGVLTFDNSWSASWGDRGRFRITVGDFAYLLKQQGDVTAPVPLAA
jgi:hypothetical protein